MKYLLCIAISLVSALVTSQGPDPVAQQADALFAQGKFDGAKKMYNRALESNDRDRHVLQRLGQIALYENRFPEAESRLAKLLQIDPGNNAAKSLLAQAYYRQDRFKEEISILRQLKRDAEADQLEILSQHKAYETSPGFTRAEIPFTQVDPLPVLEVSVNGCTPKRFFIDTGGAEVIIDKAFAESLGLKVAGREMGTFAGGKQASLQSSVVDSLTMTGFTVKNIPVMTLDMSQLGSVLGGKIDGCIGTVFLYHFLSTIDYPHCKLVLRPKNSRFDEKGDTTRVPFWMAGDHIILAWAHLNNAPEHLFFVDTGLAGAALDAQKSILDEAGIKLDPKSNAVGVGGGGEVQINNFIVGSITLGKIHGTDLPAVYDANFALASVAPFQIAGLVSHAFFKPYALTFDFRRMNLALTKARGSHLPQPPSHP